MRAAVLLCVSLAAPSLAWAQDATPFVTQIRVPARGASVDAMAWRTREGVAVARADLDALDIVTPDGAPERILLSSVPGLSFVEDSTQAAIIISCTTCFEAQRLAEAPTAQRIDRARGAYVNYDLDLQWIEDDGASAASVAEAAVFGRFGLLESSAIALTGANDDRLTRLETRWTLDDPARRLRYRFGDAAALTASDAPVRFAGIQIGRHFGLEPSFITYPSPLISGEAASTSTVELYVDGALRAREQVAAGPFVFDNAPLVSGGGDAQVVITDIAGRQQIVSRPFFVSTSLLRPGLTDWAISLGAERLAFGEESAQYGDHFFSARYRRGLTRALTAEAALDLSDDATTAQAGMVFADVTIGQVRATHTQSDTGGASTLAWFQDGDAWSVGMQGDRRDQGFRALGLDESNLQESFAGYISVELGSFGSASLTAASVDYFDDEGARTVTLAFSPSFEEASISARLIYTERVESEVAFALTFTTSLRGDVGASAGYSEDRRGPSYRASLQRGADYEGGLGWRVRASSGRREFAEAAVSRRGGIGDTSAQIARSNGVTAARLGHSGSFGFIEGTAFAAAPIRGGFALVDAGAPDVAVTRDRFLAGVTGESGRTLIVGLRPYDANIIAIRADDLPFNQTPAQTEMRVTPAEGAGVIVRFESATEPLIETRVAYANREAPIRGAILVRQRDGARFPIGANGRIVLRGARDGDIVRLDLDARCTARADEAAAASGLLLECVAA